MKLCLFNEGGSSVLCEFTSGPTPDALSLYFEVLTKFVVLAPQIRLRRLV